MSSITSVLPTSDCHHTYERNRVLRGMSTNLRAASGFWSTPCVGLWVECPLKREMVIRVVLADDKYRRRVILSRQFFPVTGTHSNPV